MTSVRELVSHRGFQDMEPEELAGHLLLDLKREGDQRSNELNLHNFTNGLAIESQRVVAEAWSYLERQGLIACVGDWFFVTRRGQKIQTPADVEALRATQFPDALLHPEIVRRARQDFIRNDYDSAVFKAFKGVEIRVRDAGSFDAKDIGANLMRKAFHSKDGPLSDQSVPSGEREALQHLAAGAFGYARNPAGHRDVGFSDPAEAIEMIGIASLLLRIVDKAVDRTRRHVDQ